jgi:hypothetical protein
VALVLGDQILEDLLAAVGGSELVSQRQDLGAQGDWVVG